MDTYYRIDWNVGDQSFMEFLVSDEDSATEDYASKLLRVEGLTSIVLYRTDFYGEILQELYRYEA